MKRKSEQSYLSLWEDFGLDFSVKLFSVCQINCEKQTRIFYPDFSCWQNQKNLFWQKNALASVVHFAQRTNTAGFFSPSLFSPSPPFPRYTGIIKLYVQDELCFHMNSNFSSAISFLLSPFSSFSVITP